MTYAQPVFPVLLLLLLALGIRNRKRSGNAACFVAAALFAWSWPPVSWLLAGSLEWRYPPGRPAGDVETIVVLGEGVRSPPQIWREESLPSFETYARCRYAAWVYHDGHAVRVVASGGPATLGKPSRVAEVMQHILLGEGIPAEALWVEDQSSSTYENAVYVAQLLHAKGIHRVTLVTGAYHMRRAEAAFRKQRLEVVPAPCCFRTLDISPHWTVLIPSTRALQVNNEILHEWIGMLWYKVSGKI